MKQLPKQTYCMTSRCHVAYAAVWCADYFAQSIAKIGGDSEW